MRNLILFLTLIIGASEASLAQQSPKESLKNTYEGVLFLDQSESSKAEQSFRTASAQDTLNAIADYNLGNTLFEIGAEEESFGHFKAASQKSTSESLSHQAFHNMGNVFMKRKEYENAVQAYKEALKKNPDDDEPRYNYALAKKMLEDEQQQNDQNQDKDQDQDQNQDQENQDQQNEGGDSEENGDQDESDSEQDQSDKGGDDQQEKEEQKKGDGDQKQEQGRKPEDQRQNNTPQPQELSKEQIEALLQALQNEENKVQEKMNAQKVQGRKLKVEKDW
ncbi:MAG: tetratricopeptide repeat protein [Flavobacteriaceae bacterium]